MSINTLLIRVAASAALICCLSGCGSGNGSDISGRYEALRFVAVTDKASYNPGEKVNFTFTATNTGSSSVRVTGTGLGTGNLADPVPITTRIEKAGRHISSIVNNNQDPIISVTLGPGESKTGRETWDQIDDNGAQVPAGAYTLTVTLDAGRVNGVDVQSGDAFAAPPIPIVIH